MTVTSLMCYLISYYIMKLSEIQHQTNQSSMINFFSKSDHPKYKFLNANDSICECIINAHK